jgi:hypothetical protein
VRVGNAALENAGSCRLRLLSAQLVSGHPVANSAVPPEAAEGDITKAGNKFFGPDGSQFGTRKNDGLFSFGATPIAKFLADNPGQFAGVSPSLVRIMRAVSDNEGKLEAVNSYDSAFMSFGIFQWTAGSGVAKGELADLLDRLKTSRPQVFAHYFGKNGLDVDIGAPAVGALRTGFLVLNGTALSTEPRKRVLRTPIWGYRFWRAGHDTDVRACEIEQAMARIDVFYRVAKSALGGRAVSDFVTSEVGVAHLLDQHVNRPGHVPKTLVAAIKAFTAATGKGDPTTWTTADERDVLKRYLADRHANTSMTDSKKRAKRINDAVTAGQLSDARGSFQ